MGIGIGILLIAVGAILTFAVHATVNGVDIQTVGVILMIVGAVGLIIDLAIFMPRRRTYRRESVCPPPSRRRPAWPPRAPRSPATRSTGRCSPPTL